ncbi:MAG: EamA family transporter [Chitinophagaceae bacterium]
MEKPGRGPSQLLIVSAFAAIYIIWGSTYIAIAIAIRDIPPLLMAGIRFIAAGILLYAFARIRGEATPDRSSVAHLSFSGILMLFLGTGSVAWVEQYLPSGLTAIIVATVPLWFVLLDRQQWKFYFSNGWIIAGLLVGFGGVLFLFADKRAFSFTGDRMKVTSFFVLLFGTIAWAIGSLYSKYKPVQGSTFMKAAVQMVAAGICALLAGFIAGEHHRVVWAAVSWQSILAVVYLIVFGSLVGYLSYIWLLGVRPPSLVGTYAYVNPVVAVFLGWLIVSEPITWQQLVALLIILSGVILVNIAKEKRAPATGKTTGAPSRQP